MNKREYSVLISVYNKEATEYFEASIESMLNQSLLPEQIVIVKDGKLTKELDLLIDCFIKKHPEIFTIVNLKQNLGLGLALNQGLDSCRNELVARMDTDDISVKDRCAIQVEEFIQDSNLTIVGSFIDEFQDDHNTIISSRTVPTTHEEILRFSRRRNPFNHPTVMYKKSEVLKNGGYGDFRRNQDLDLFVRMLNNGAVGKNINQSLVLFRANEENLKRRKSWIKCKSYIVMIYNFWRKGYSSFLDLLIVATSQTMVFVAPTWFLKWISNNFLRKTS